jgi:acetylornithine deacetylase
MNSLAAYIDLLISLISIPATSRKEAQRADFLEKALKGLGPDVERIHNNLMVGHAGRKEGGINLLLNSHLDTVSPVEGWERDPFTPFREGERITGLGSNDAGASVVALIAAYLEMAPRLKGEINLTLLISAEEEVSGDKGISAVLPRLEAMDAVIVGEPTGMKPAVAERGLMVLDGEVTGRAGHAGRNEGENAIYKAMQDIGSIASLSFSEHSDWLPDPGAQVTMISAGTGHNVVPDVCRYVVDVRSNDRYDNERMLGIISGLCQADLVPRSIRLKPSTLEKDHLLMRTLLACGLEPFGSSTLSDMALIPFPAIKMGPGDSARSHTAGEYILISELEAGVEGYCRFLSTMGEIVKRTSKRRKVT